MSKIDKAVEWAVAIAKDDSHGYSQAWDKRWGKPDFDCSSLVISAWKQAGIPLTCTFTGNMRADFKKNGFVEVPLSQRRRGDILLNEKYHTALCVDENTIVQASISENGTIYGKEGDQTGKEILVRPYYAYSKGWDCVLRYAGEDEIKVEPSKSEPVKNAPNYYVICQGDTLYKISRQFGMSIDDILKLNPSITNPNRIYAGQKLVIKPALPNSTPAYALYRVVTMYEPLNIRAGASASTKKIGECAKGSIIEVSSISNGWAKLANREGYVSCAYIKKV